MTYAVGGVKIIAMTMQIVGRGNAIATILPCEGPNWGRESPDIISVTLVRGPSGNLILGRQGSRADT